MKIYPKYTDDNQIGKQDFINNYVLYINFYRATI